MVTTIFFVLFISQFLRAMLSLPVAHDFKSVSKIYGTLDSSVKNKRAAIESYHSCAQGMVLLNNSSICVTIKEYNEYNTDDYDEMSSGPQDKDMTSEPSPTTHAPRIPPHPGPMLEPGGTSTAQPRSSAKLTEQPQKPPQPSPTLLDPPTTSSPVPSPASKASKPSSPYTMMTIIFFVLCVYLLHCAVFTLPISQDATLVPSSDSEEVASSMRNVACDSDAILKLSQYFEYDVKNLEGKHLFGVLNVNCETELT